MLTDVVLVGAGGKYALNQTGGAESVSYTPAGTVGGTAITVDQMPSHAHSAWTDSQGGHAHDRGNMGIYGFLTVRAGTDATSGTNFSGAFFYNSRGDTEQCVSLTGGKSQSVRIQFQANRNWSGATNTVGAHGHNVGIGDTGNGQAHDHGFTGTETTISTMMPFIGKYIWQRDS